ncbi:MAG: hypothetical protein IH605_00970 [Burkholderiales bacterium]|nr:hypothetical protein [Burkholderiales bacterium]
MPAKKPATTITGACGEHYIAAYLSGFGLVVAIPRHGTPNFDLLVANDKGGHAICLQVKTGRKAYENRKTEGEIYLWDTPRTVIELDDENLWYAYVWLNGWPDNGNLPQVFFVPSKRVVQCIKKDKGKRTFFWMYADEARKYRGRLGLDSLINALDT